jgi:hypothetical protein
VFAPAFSYASLCIWRGFGLLSVGCSCVLVCGCMFLVVGVCVVCFRMRDGVWWECKDMRLCLCLLCGEGRDSRDLAVMSWAMNRMCSV